MKPTRSPFDRRRGQKRGIDSMRIEGQQAYSEPDVREAVEELVTAADAAFEGVGLSAISARTDPEMPTRVHFARLVGGRWLPTGIWIDVVLQVTDNQRIGTSSRKVIYDIFSGGQSVTAKGTSSGSTNAILGSALRHYFSFAISRHFNSLKS